MLISKKILYVALAIIPFQMSAQVMDLCIDNFDRYKCAMHLTEELESDTMKVKPNEIESLYKIIKKISAEDLSQKDLGKIEDFYVLSLLMDEYINRSFYLLSGAKEIPVVDEKENYLVDGINKRLDIYFKIIEKYPYSKYASSAAMGINHYSIILCDIDSNNCDSYLKQALHYIKMLTEKGSNSLLNKSFTAWRWYNDALLKEYVTNLYLGNYNENIEIRNKIKNYREVVNEFGVRHTSNGIVSSDYIDQIYINLITPQHETRLRKYFSNEVVASQLFLIEEAIENNTDTNTALNIYHSFIKKLENNDYFVLVKSTESQFKAESVAKEIKNLSNNKDGEINIILNKAKVVPPSQGKYWGAGLGPLSHTEVELFKANADHLKITDYYIMRQRVLPE